MMVTSFVAPTAVKTPVTSAPYFPLASLSPWMCTGSHPFAETVVVLFQ